MVFANFGRDNGLSPRSDRGSHSNHPQGGIQDFFRKCKMEGWWLWQPPGRAVHCELRLWQQQGRKEEARRMLAEIYGWVTEEFDTTDLKEARVLLEALAGHS